MQKSRCLFSFITEAIFFIVARRRYESQFCPCFSCQPWQFSSGGHALLVRRSFVFVLLSMISCKSSMSYIPIRIPMALASPVWP